MQSSVNQAAAYTELQQLVLAVITFRRSMLVTSSKSAAAQPSYVCQAINQFITSLNLPDLDIQNHHQFDARRDYKLDNTLHIFSGVAGYPNEDQILLADLLYRAGRVICIGATNLQVSLFTAFDYAYQHSGGAFPHPVPMSAGLTQVELQAIREVYVSANIPPYCCGLLHILGLCKLSHMQQTIMAQRIGFEEAAYDLARVSAFAAGRNFVVPCDIRKAVVVCARNKFYIAPVAKSGKGIPQWELSQFEELVNKLVDTVAVGGASPRAH